MYIVRLIVFIFFPSRFNEYIYRMLESVYAKILYSLLYDIDPFSRLPVTCFWSLLCSSWKHLMEFEYFHCLHRYTLYIRVFSPSLIRGLGMLGYPFIISMYFTTHVSDTPTAITVKPMESTWPPRVVVRSHWYNQKSNCLAHIKKKIIFINNIFENSRIRGLDMHVCKAFFFY